MFLAKNLSFRFPDEPEYLFENLSFHIDTKTKAGLVGRNGCGKSTLIKILSGDERIVSGSLFRRENVVIGHLPQEIHWENEQTAFEYLWQSRPKLWEKFRYIEEITQGKVENPDSSVFEEYGEEGGYEFETELKKTATDFSLSPSKLEQRVSTLSGGEKTRLALACVLLEKPDLLLLDEPTNHLDIEALKWLETYLSKTVLPFVAISHDREFLDICTNRTWELNKGSMTVYSGNYSSYRREKDLAYARAQEQYQTQQRKIRQLKIAARERRDWAGTHQGQTGKEGYAPVYESITNFAKSAMKKAKNVEKRIELMIEKEEAKKPWIDKRRKIVFDRNAKKLSSTILQIENLSMSYDRVEVLPSTTLIVERGKKLAVVGPNGSGKTTLLRIIVGLLKPYHGKVAIPPKVEIAYFAQEYENLNPQNSIITEIVGENLEEQTQARTVLGSLGICGEKVHQKIHTLSSGERSKVSLAKAILSQSDLLVLDEPTNHLEIPAQEAIEDALMTFPGTIVFASHDRKFVANLADEVYEIKNKDSVCKKEG